MSKQVSIPKPYMPLEIQFSSTWIMDSGASNHMISSSKSFNTYSPCLGNQKIKIADRTLVSIAGRGNISISPSLTLKNVLHVPKAYWGEDFLTTTHLINRLPSKVFDFKETVNLLTQFYSHFDGFSRIALKIFRCGGVCSHSDTS